jgi:RNA polymerase sigma factor (sigma-70 family)
MLNPSAISLVHIPLPGTKREENICQPKPVPEEIAVLTRSLARGDEEAFREFHARYFQRLYQFLLVLTRGQDHEAQEALQQTLLRVVHHARTFDSEEAFWCWLKVVARSAVRDSGRKQQRYWALLRNFSLRWGVASNAAGSDTEQDLRLTLEETLDELAPVDRQLIQFKYLEGYSVKELSAQTGLTEKAVESRLLRARRQLRESLLKKFNHR